MTSAVEDYETLLGLLSEWDRAHRSGFDMAAFGNLSARTKQALRGVGFKDGGYLGGEVRLIGDVQFTETDRLLAEAARAKLGLRKPA